MLHRLLFLTGVTGMVSIMVTLSSCQKITEEITMAEKSSTAPEYSVEMDANTSPTESKKK